MRKMFAIAALCGTCLIPSDTQADSCRRVAVVRHVAVNNHHAVAVVNHHAVVATYAAVPVVTAAYSVGYNDSGTQALIAELRQLRADVQKLTAGGKQTVPTGSHPAVSLFSQKCASCHDASVSAAKGGGFSMFIGSKLIDLSDKAKLKIVSEIGFNRMPKGGKLTQDEFDAVMNFFDTRAQANAEAIQEQPKKE